MKRTFIGWLAGSAIPPLAASEVLVQQGKLLDSEAWLIVLGIAITSTIAVTINALTQLNAEAGNPPVVIATEVATGVTKKP